ncbi:type I restriction enzyme HsdR N-terminal domain-containing protein [Leptolyngbya cf. ectocarpi LEGE 11479]|uniref:Type I restriction enzyme HsdR N-terminal domain-containing protein n=1 Tax=Leptolyngbya cf. ectocarpi LEGE 11479 TaxID=1828722 RepID=A0A929FDG8_LEPEC|nr:type I restriction enzyme HsdR N-terminal domain-containing protein [Leptolyngbya ectocarpi]MBE9070583.1 type I restriction enzyme HsdR N-terminal domain-containing protein [Leptolyngbya cf. ectocarpi LEGE 11479]
MVQAIRSSEVSLEELESHFGLTLTENPAFFPEWQAPDLKLTESEVQRLNQVKQHFRYLLRQPPVLEGAVKMVVLSPLLELAGFYEPPFQIRSEAEISISSKDPDTETVVRGAIDILVLMEKLWLLVIEAKMSDFSLTKALAQALSHMLASPEAVTFGMITNGTDFVFLRVNTEETATYSSSRVFSLLSPTNELIDVLTILKTLGQKIIKTS